MTDVPKPLLLVHVIMRQRFLTSISANPASKNTKAKTWTSNPRYSVSDDLPTLASKITVDDLI